MAAVSERARDPRAGGDVVPATVAIAQGDPPGSVEGAVAEAAYGHRLTFGHDD